ncbi:3'(2'),5'-bisphosphate nucleotidase CysQ, partial [bacterium]|nr:3'(2'),5'-bisphosphate nucleotidase CysQ [bacterium]
MNMDLNRICEIAKQAGEKILEIYGQDDFNIEQKEDNSPLTAADRASHAIISNALSASYPDIPLLSEEGKHMPYEERKHWHSFWVVDPLDGTKEFIKRNGEFTVNIALVTGGLPVAGVIYVPVTDVLYYARKDLGAFRRQGDGEPGIIHTDTDIRTKLIAVRSRSHASPEEEAYAGKTGCSEIISAGSSLKFCRVAEGEAHYYYRHGPTMEWDTAAG